MPSREAAGAINAARPALRCPDIDENRDGTARYVAATEDLGVNVLRIRGTALR